jgi:hypothetical protein
VGVLSLPDGDVVLFKVQDEQGGLATSPAVAGEPGPLLRRVVHCWGQPSCLPGLEPSLPSACMFR